jgi:septal ring-binding cell division protein DamX
MKYWHCIAIVLLLLLLIILAIGIALVQAPEVTTNDATDVTSDTATLNGNLTSLGNASSVDVWFQYTTDAYYIK